MHVGFRCSEMSKAPRSSTGCKNGLSPSSLKIVWSLILYGVFCCILNTFENFHLTNTPGLISWQWPFDVDFLLPPDFLSALFCPDSRRGWFLDWSILVNFSLKSFVWRRFKALRTQKETRSTREKYIYRVPEKNGTVDTIDFWGLCSNQQLSLFTLLDIASFPHYNNTKIIKFGWELFILWVISYGLSFSGFAWFPEFRGTINDKLMANPENYST